MPRIDPASVRRQIVARLRSGESVADVAAETGVCQATRFRWKRQALVDAGVIEGVPSVEADELAAAHKRIAALEAELALTRDACELFNTEAVVPPKRRRAITEGLIARRTFSSICLPDHGVWRVPCCTDAGVEGQNAAAIADEVNVHDLVGQGTAHHPDALHNWLQRSHH